MEMNVLKPDLSIIIPVYNTERYIRDCLDSILSQTFKNYEVILVDDESTDNSSRICDEFATKDCRLKVIHADKGGYQRPGILGLMRQMANLLCL